MDTLFNSSTVAITKPVGNISAHSYELGHKPPGSQIFLLLCSNRALLYLHAVFLHCSPSKLRKSSRFQPTACLLLVTNLEYSELSCHVPLVSVSSLDKQPGQ
jgi:hypothetical protein